MTSGSSGSRSRRGSTATSGIPTSSGGASSAALAPTAGSETSPRDWRWQDALSPQERRELLQVDTLPALRSLAANWGLIYASFALVAYLPNPFTVVFAIFILGARQLGLAILMHEAAHRTLLPNRAWNDFAGNWLAAYPIWADLTPYRPYHLLHHAKTGTRQDPDLGLTRPFPITRGSFLRKVWRDLSGQTGIKQARAVLLRDLGWSRRRNQRSAASAGSDASQVGWRRLLPVALTNAVIFVSLALLGHPELYALWVVAWLTTYRLCTRIRSIAEHALTPDLMDPLGNTRTTLASWWERLFIAPNFVNYHLEHHLLMTVPHDKLPRLHRLLHERGALDGACIARNYWQVLREATSKPPRPSP